MSERVVLHQAELPAWLSPLQERIATMRGSDLSGFAPPTDPHHPAPREGAVLVLFGDGPQGPDLTLTERAHTMRAQPGQVSFPGGSVDPGEDAVAAAVREGHEELGVAPDDVEVFAVLPRLWLPPRNFAVAPVLAYWKEPADLDVVNPAEVHAVIRVSIADLLDPAQRFTVRHPLGWEGPGWMIGPERDVMLWGFTAGVITALLDFVGWTEPWDASVVKTLPDDQVDWERIVAALKTPRDETDRALVADVRARLDPEQLEALDDRLDRDHRPAS